MKFIFRGMVVLVSGFFLMNAYAMTVQLRGQEAKTIYNAMTAVQEDGAAGHSYRKGKSVLCRYTNADMDDKRGRPIGREDVRRFACVMKINQEGLAVAPESF